MVESRQMAGHRRSHWSEHLHNGDVCIGCSRIIDYSKGPALVYTQVGLAWDAPDSVKDFVEKFYMCAPCGTDIDKVHEMGMKRCLGLHDPEPEDIADPVDDEPEETVQ